MTDESGGDAKILAVPITKLCGMYKNTNSINDLPPMLLKQISHFFEHYKDLEDNKWVKLDGWADVDAAKKEITDSVIRFNETKEKPNF
jgi:inorganic pyrophosphatase